MSKYITIDGGTTNTRIRLVSEGKITAVKKFGVGAGKCTDDSSALRNVIKEGICEIIAENGIDESEICCIIASGMLTSEFGLYPLPHAIAPVGISELHETTEKVILDDISQIPFVFIRGVKIESENLSSSDMMRGEETELMGLSDKIDGDAVYILPGSHSKIIKTDKDGKISDFSTLLTGEMLSALSKNTILKGSFDPESAAVNSEYLKKGFLFCREHGINKSLFKVRVLKNNFSATGDEAYSFFFGVVLCGEIEEILKFSPKKIIIGGNCRIKRAMTLLLSEFSSATVIEVPDDRADAASTIGAIKIYEYPNI